MVIQVTDGSKKCKCYLKHDINGDKDIISDLPNCVRSRILSFLPTKDAVATCILSTRWQNLWTCLPHIDLDDKLVYSRSKALNETLLNSSEYEPFHSFVERVLIHRNVTNVTKFRLSCTVWRETRVSPWISSAINQNVKELELFLVLQNPFQLPPCVFNCQSLRTLKICMECTLMLPENVFLPNLKMLHLGAVGFSDEESLTKLLSGCTSLEELKLIGCSWGKLESITISLPSITILRIDELIDDSDLWFPDKRSDCIIKVQLPNLESFEYFGGSLNGIVLENQLLQLCNATVFVLEKPGSKFDTAPDVFNLFTKIKHASILRVSSCAIKCLFVAERFLGQIPTFQKLTRLELNLEYQDIFPDALFKFLVSFPHLEILTFHEGAVSGHLRLHDDVFHLMSSPKCNMLRLKMIKLCYLRGGNIADLSFLKDLVDIAPALEKMCVRFCSAMDSSKKEKISLMMKMLLDGSKGNFTVLFL